MHNVQLHSVDYLILGIYIVFVLGIGWALKRYMKTSTDFFLSGRAIPAWITALAFISANLGANEVIGMGAQGAKYGLLTCHFYWIGAVPAMVFIGLFMMPFYYGSKARSVPEYLKLRFDEKTRGFNAISFAAMTIFQSGISMYAVSMLLNVLLGWSFHLCVSVSAVIVLVYIVLGGLTSAIYNEVLQFFLIFLGFLPLVLLGLSEVGGWHGLVDKLNGVAVSEGFHSGAWTSIWANTGSTADNPMHIHWFGMAMGLGFVLAFGYWCTDFLVVQRAMAAESMSAARRTPILAIIPKIMIPAIVIVPGMIALIAPRRVEVPTLAAQKAPEVAAQTMGSWRGLIPPKFKAEKDGTIVLERDSDGKVVMDYDKTIPAMLIQYFPTGLLGLGLTALMASFMSGMAGNVTAFNTVWTYDIYQTYIAPNRSDQHYLRMGRMATVFGIVVSIGPAYLATRFNNIMDFIQLTFGFVNAPLFATFLLGMFWKRTTGHGAFYGLLSGTGAAALHQALTAPNGSWIKVLHDYKTDMAQNFWMAICAWTTCFVVTIVVSLATRRKKSDEELRGLVYSLTPRVKEDRRLAWIARPAVLAALLIVATIALNVIFW
jgi:SSS family solute:Na+ symporter